MRPRRVSSTMKCVAARFRAAEELVERLLHVLLVTHRALRIVDDIGNMTLQTACDGGQHQARSAMSTNVGTQRRRSLAILARGGDALGAQPHVAHGAGLVRLLEKAVARERPSRGEKRHRELERPAPPSRWRAATWSG